MGIQKETAEIVKKAKKEAKKIDACKSKLRQSAMGGVITNSLAEKARQVSKSRANQKKESQKDKIEPQIQIKADLEPTQSSQTVQKAKKKKKKRSNLKQDETYEE